MSMSNKKILAAAEKAAKNNGYKFQNDNSQERMSDSQILQQAKSNATKGFSFSEDVSVKKPNGQKLNYNKESYNRAIAIARNKRTMANNSAAENASISAATEVNAGKDNNTSTSFLDRFKSPINKEGNTGYDRFSGNAKETTLRKLYTSKTGEKDETTNEYLEKQQKLVNSYDSDVQSLAEEYNKVKKEYENQSAIDTANAANGFYGSTNTTDYSKQLKEIKAKLTEKGLSDDEIDQLAEAESWVYNASQRQEQKKSLESTTESTAGNIGAHALDVAVNSVAAIPAAVQIVADKVAGKRTDPNANAFAITNFQNDLEEGQQEKNSAYWQEKTGKEDSWQEKAANFGYNVGMSTSKSLAAAIEGGGFASALGLSGAAATVVGNMVTLPSFGEQALVSTYNEAKERGIDDDRALKTAVVSGLAEMGTEVISLDKLWDVYKSAGKAGAKNWVMNAFVQAGIEGSEEGANDIINQIADLAINGDQSAYADSVNQYMTSGMSQEKAEKVASKDFWWQTFEDFLAGAASGGISAVVATGAGVHNNRTTGNNIQGNEETFVNGISDDRADFNNDRDYQDAQQTVLDVIDSEGKELSNKEKYNLGKRVNEAVETQNTSFNDNIDNANARIISNKINSANTVEELASIQDRIPEKYASKESITKAIQTKAATLGATTEDLQAIQTPEKAYKAAYEGKITSEDIDQIEDKAIRNFANEGLLKRTAEIIKDTKTSDIESALVNKKVKKLTSEVSVENDKVYVNTEEGEKVELSPDILNKNGELFWYGNGAQIGVLDLDSTDLMTIAIDTQKSSEAPSGRVLNAIKQFNTVGRTTNQTFDEFMQKKSSQLLAKGISEEYLKKAFELNKSELETSDKRKEEGKVGKSKGVITKGFAEALSESEDIGPVTMLVKTLNTKVGLKLDAKEMEGGSRANYNPETGTITLNKEMINEAYSALFHEGFGEYLQKHNAKDYKAISDAMLNYLEDKLGSKAYTKMVDAYQQAYRRSHTVIDENKTAREAANEMVNDTLFAMFSSKEGMQDMIDWTSEAMPVQERKSFLEAIKGIFDDILKALDHFLKTGSFNSAERAALEMEKDQAKAMRQMVLDAMDVAIENRDAAASASEIVAEVAVEGRQSIKVDERVSANEDLVAIHNITADELIKSIKLGGFPMPSIAVIRAGMGHNEFGEVSIVFGRDTIDPKKSKKHKLYSGDAYTPVFPKVDYDVDSAKVDDIADTIKDLIGQDKYELLGPINIDRVERALEMERGNATAYYKNDATLQFAYLEKNGEHIEPKYVEQNVSKNWENFELLQICEKLGKDTIFELKEKTWPRFSAHVTTEEFKKNNPGLIEDIQHSLNAAWKVYYDIDEFYKDGDLDISKIRSLLNACKTFIKQNGVNNVIDVHGFKDEIKANIKGHEEDFSEWLNELFDGVVKDVGVWNGKEYITDRGRRTFKQTHYPLTLDGIVKGMSLNGNKGADAFGGGILGVATEEFASINEAKKQNERLQLMNQEEYDKLKKKYNDEFFDLATQVSINGDSYSATEILQDVLKQGTSKEAIRRNLIKEKDFLKLQEDSADRLYDLVKKVQKMPTGYFEAKPMRAVYLDEILNVVCPSTETELISVLEENNIPYETYEEGNEEARKEAVNTTENARFSIKVLDDGNVAENLSDILSIEEYTELRSMIDSGNKPTYQTKIREKVYRLDSKLVYTDNGKLNFGISKIVDVKRVNNAADANAILDLYSDIDTKGINYEQQVRLIKDYFGEKCFKEYTNKDWGSAERYDRPTERNKSRSDAYHAEREQNRRRVYIKDGSVVDDSRKSIKVADARNSFKTYGEASPYTDSLEEVEVISTMLSKANSALGGIKSVKKASLTRVARSVTNKYKSNVDVEELSNHISQAFSVMAENKLENNYETVMDYLLNIGDEVINNSQLKDLESERIYNAAKDNLKRYNIKLTDADKAELKNTYGTLIKGMGTLKKYGINIAKDGQTVDSLYSQIQDEMLNITGVKMEDVSPADELLEIIGTMESVEPTAYLWEGANDLDKSLSVVADIVDGYYTEVAKTYNKDAEKSALFKAKKSLNEQFEKYKATKEQAYEAKLNSLIAQLEERNQAGWQPYMDDWADFNLKLMTEKEIKATAKQRANKQFNSYKEAEEKAKQINNIRRTGNRMIKWLTQPTDKQHVPDFLRKPLGDFLNGIDFIGGKGDTKTALEWQSRMDSLKALMQKVERAEISGEDSIEAYFAQGTIASEIVDKMEHFINTYGANKKLRDLDAKGLKELSEIMSSISAAINSLNTTYANSVFADRGELARQTVHDISQLKKRQEHTKAGNAAIDFLSMDELEPIRYFERLGGAAKSVFDELRKGFDVRTARIKEASEHMEQFKKESNIDVKAVSKWSNDFKDFDLEAGKVTLTIPQIMSLYELSKREQAKPHIVLGGIKAADFEGTKKILHHQSRAVHIHYNELMQIIDTLTDDQKAMADAMQKYMATECSKWGNNVTKKMFGYSKFTEEDYFPIRTDSMSRGVNASTDNVPSYYTIKNQGFTKALTPSAKNALVLEDIFDVFTRHVTGMANYEGYTLAISDAMRWFNYSETIQNAMVQEGDVYGTLNDTQNNVREAIDEALGKKGNEYFQQFIKDINGDYAGTGGEIDLLNTMMGNYKAQAVMANVRVVVQQPTAIVRVVEQIEGKYLLKAQKSLKDAAKYAEKAQENAPIAYWKAQGYYETLIGKSMKGIITGDEGIRDKINAAAGWAAGKADDLTWGIMYRAAELKVQETMPELVYDSEEFTEETVKLFNSIIDHTQVVDTVFHKSQFMRNQSAEHKMLSAFMAEPTKTYNMLAAAVWDIHQADNKTAKQAAVNKAGRIARIFIVEQALNAIVTALVDVARDDDKEGWSLEIYWNQLKENFFDNLKVWNLVPIVKEIENMLDGYDTTNYQMESISSVIGMIQKMAKWSTTPLYGKLYTVAQAISQVSGVPFATALREVKTLNNNLNDIWNGKDWYKTADAEKTADKSRTYNKAVEIYDSNDLNEIKLHLKEIYDEKLEGEDATEGDGYKAMRAELKEQFQRQYDPESSSRISVINRYKTLLKQTKKSDGKGGYRTLSDKEIANMIDGWIESQD